MDIKRLDFFQFLVKLGYGWSILPFIGILIITKFMGMPFFAFAIIFVLILIIINSKTEYDEYLDFMAIVESNDYEIYLQNVKSSGQIDVFLLGNDCDIIIKNDTMYWFIYKTKLGTKNIIGLSFCLEFNSFERPVEILGSYFNTIENWKITSRGNIQLIGKKQKHFSSKLLITIFNNTQEIQKYLPPNLKIN